MFAVRPEVSGNQSADMAMVNEDRAYLIEHYSVPRETIEQLDRYAALLVEWQSRLNLVGPATIPDLWVRHFLDSAQLLDHAPGRALDWLDLGSGAGFPGLVIAIMRPDVRITLVESRAKKCTFLNAVADACGIADRVTVLAERIEALPDRQFDVISARALASLSQLFDWGLRFAESNTLWLLPKGASVESELADARRKFSFSATLRPSITDPAARIVLARDVERRNRK